MKEAFLVDTLRSLALITEALVSFASDMGTIGVNLS